MKSPRLLPLALGSCLLSFSAAAEGLDMPRSDEAMDYLAPKIMADAHPRWTPARGQAGAAWGGFMVWPTISAGNLIDSNPRQAHDPRRTAIGLRVRPSVVAEREGGVHATTVYGKADARLYANEPMADTLEGRAGFVHDWALQRTLLVRVQGDVSRSIDRVDSREAVTGRTVGRPFAVQRATASASVQKTFNNLFVSVSGAVLRSSFDDTGAARDRVGRRAVSDQTSFDVKARVGTFVAPMLYAFTEPAANWRVLDAGDQHSEGTRIVAGLGSDRLGLLAGEVYGGLQRQNYTRRPSPVAEPIVGARLAWMPSPAWTVAVRFDRSLEQAAVGTAGEPLGTPVRDQALLFRVRYELSPAWALHADLERIAIDYLGTPRRDRLISLGAALDYAVHRNLDMTADLRLTDVQSTVALAAYQRLQATLGAVYHY